VFSLPFAVFEAKDATLKLISEFGIAATAGLHFDHQYLW
jgi:hypothetical protein